MQILYMSIFMRLSRFTSILRANAHAIPAHPLNAQTQQPVVWRPAAQPEKGPPGFAGHAFFYAYRQTTGSCWLVSTILYH
jgi:hypothetical protein